MSALPASLSTLGVGALFTAIVAGWQQVKNIVARLMGVMVVTVEFEDGYAGHAARAYVHQKLRPTSTPFWSYTGRMKFVRPWKRYGCVMYERPATTGRLYWHGYVPFWIAWKPKQVNPATEEKMVFRFLRGTFKPDSLAQEVASYLTEAKSGNRFAVHRMAGRSGKNVKQNSSPESAIAASDSDDEGYRLVGWQKEDLEEQVGNEDPIDRLSLTDETMDVVGAVRRWFKSKDWYATRQIPWRFGVLLHGRPGTGKSSLTKALAQSLNVPLVVMDISTMDNEEFHASYQRALGHAPAIVLMEDIDAVFHGRDNVAAEKGQGLTFDCLLNVISGVEKSDGILLVVTTNDLSKIDPALGVQSGGTSSRPGRIDRVIELPALTEAGRYKVARRILAGCHESWIEHLVRHGATDTGAQFEDRCATQALSLYWSDNSNAPAPTGSG